MLFLLTENENQIAELTSSLKVERQERKTAESKLSALEDEISETKSANSNLEKVQCSLVSTTSLLFQCWYESSDPQSTLSCFHCSIICFCSPVQALNDRKKRAQHEKEQLEQELEELKAQNEVSSIVFDLSQEQK